MDIFHISDPRSKDMFLSGSPLPTLGLLGLYYYFIFDIGPKLMQNRPAFKLERIMLIYNLFQVIANGYIVFVVRLIFKILIRPRIHKQN